MNLQYTTQRLVLQSVDPSAAPMVLDFLSRNREEFECWDRTHDTAYYTEEYQYKAIQAEQNLMLNMKGVRFYAFLKNLPDIIIGSISYAYLSDDDGHRCMIGYKFDRQYRGRGYAYEATAFLTNIIFRECRVKRIEADIISHNYASIKLAERLGFKFEGVARGSHEVNGFEEDHNRYSLLASDFLHS